MASALRPLHCGCQSRAVMLAGAARVDRVRRASIACASILEFSLERLALEVVELPGVARTRVHSNLKKAQLTP